MLFKYNIVLTKERREGGKEEGSYVASLFHLYMPDHTAYLKTDVQREWQR